MHLSDLVYSWVFRSRDFHWIHSGVKCACAVCMLYSWFQQIFLYRAHNLYSTSTTTSSSSSLSVHKQGKRAWTCRSSRLHIYSYFAYNFCVLFILIKHVYVCIAQQYICGVLISMFHTYLCFVRRVLNAARSDDIIVRLRCFRCSVCQISALTASPLWV